MKILLPLLILIAIVAGGLFYIGSDNTQTEIDVDMLKLGDFAYQQQRYDDAMQWYMKAAIQGKSKAQFQLSQMFQLGQGTEQNTELAAHWMRRAAKNGLAKAEYAYANMLLFDKDSEKADPHEAYIWFKKAAEQKYPQAMLKMAKIHLDDNGDELHLSKALDWAMKAKKVPANKSKAEALQNNIIKAIKKRALANDKHEQFKLGMMYMHGMGLLQNKAKALLWLTKSAKQGYIDAQLELGKALADSEANKSLYWLTRAAKQGHEEAGYALTARAALESKTPYTLKQEAWRWLYHGMRKSNPKMLYNFAVILHNQSLGLPQNDNHFAPWLTQAANNHITPALNDIAIYHVLKRDKMNQTRKWLEEAAELGDKAAQFNLGLLYARGESFSPSDEKALKWWKEADKNGNTKAQMLLGLFYHIGRGAGRNEEEAIGWYEKAADNGSIDALYNLAMIYYFGRGVNQDYKKSATYLQRLADHNDAQAQNILAALYLDGKGVKFSPEMAVFWFIRAARLGNVQAMFNLATQYRQGNGVAQDDKRALFWYAKAAEQNYAPAQNALGYLYAEGRGVKKDVDKAEDWFYKASDNGLVIAKKNINVLHHRGAYSLVTLQVKTGVRNAVLADKNIDLSSWLDVHLQPVL